MHLLLSGKCFFVCLLFTSACAFYIHRQCHLLAYILTFLLVTDYTMVDLLVVHIQILYYTHNILPLLTKQKLEFRWNVNNLVILQQMMMSINWLTELYTYIKMLGWWVWCFLSWCVCSDHMRCMSVCQSILFLYYSSVSCPNNTVMSLSLWSAFLLTDIPFY